MTLIGPFDQIVTLRNLSLAGPLDDQQCEIIEQGGIVVEGNSIQAVGPYHALLRPHLELQPTQGPCVAFPALIDAHTHLCFAGNRAAEYSLRLGGATYQEIRAKGGGIWNTVTSTRSADSDYLIDLMLQRLQYQRKLGIATCEIKSGYGLDVENELRCLRIIAELNTLQPVQIVSTCLAAHIVPKEFSDENSYLDHITTQLLPQLRHESLANRIDIFVEEGAFSIKTARSYLEKCREMGFRIVAHADQFTPGSARMAAELQAESVDHLEMISHDDALYLAERKVPAVVLPGATLGLGEPFPPARMLLNTGNCLVIASDWNPGTAPMGNLLTQASLLGAQQKLSMAEMWSGITFRAAHALGLHDRGVIAKGKRADIAIFHCNDWREVLYYQGSLHPCDLFIGGVRC